MRLPSLLAVAFVLLCLASTVCSEDRVTLQPENSEGLLTLTGDILDFTDTTVLMRVRTHGEQRYAASQVVAFDVFRNEAQRLGEEHLTKGDTDSAIDAFEQALAAEQRDWLRQEILAGLVRTHRQRGELDRASTRFVELISREPLSRQWRVAPLVWAPESISDALRRQAKTWLVARDEAGKLLRASMLLDDPEAGASAQLELKRLAGEAEQRVRSLAAAQLWRLDLQGAGLTDIELDRRRRAIEQMPESIRGGPWYLLGQFHLRRRELEESVAAMMWLPLIHDGDEVLASRAMFDAASSLRQLNRMPQSRELFGELIDRYPWSTYAKEAQGVK